MASRARRNSEQDTIPTSLSKVGKKTGNTDACLVVIYGTNLGKRYNLTGKVNLIGRSNKSCIHVDLESVSRKHAKITVEDGMHIIADLGSTNGTYVNDKLMDRIKLCDGDYIKIGRMIFKYLSGTNIESEYHDEIYRLTTTDGLTRAYNKRFFMESLDREINRCSRYQRYLSLCLFDLDHFKQINDTHGHLAGDDILWKLADLIAHNIRREDILARYGGEEFAIVLPEVELVGARTFAEKCRQLVEKHRFSFDGEVIQVTVSLGVTTTFGPLISHTEMIRRADIALYQAKRSGRNRVMTYIDEEE